MGANALICGSVLLSKNNRGRNGHAINKAPLAWEVEPSYTLHVFNYFGTAGKEEILRGMEEEEAVDGFAQLHLRFVSTPLSAAEGGLRVTPGWAHECPC